MIQNTKGRILISNYLFGILVFTFLVVGGISMIDLLRVDSPSMINSTKYSVFNSSFNKLDEVNSGVGGLKGSITNANPDFGAFGVLNALISTSWNALQNIFISFGFIIDMFTGLTSVFGVPAWIVGLMGSVVSIVIVFGIYAAIFQTDN